MIEIEINNSEDLIITLNKIAEKIEDRTDLMADISQTMKRAVLLNFENEGRPKWLGLKYPNSRNHILRGESGDLESSIEARSDNNQAAVGSNKVYAPIHHFGGTIRPKKGKYLKFQLGEQWVQTKKVEIPARPFLVLTQQDEEDILQDVQDYFRSLVG